MLEAYRAHVQERAELGILPKPLDPEWTAQLVELLKSPPAGEEDFLLDLVANRVPPGVDEAAYVKAGFRKIHLDTSMGCLGEPSALDDYATATRAARLAKVAEVTAKLCDLPSPLYVIGTEVPPPGGADHLISSIQPTSSEAARRTIEVHHRAFLEEGLAQAFDRVIGLVVQPGVEFGNHNVITYDPSNTTQLVTVLKDNPQFVFEAHSTDYQGLKPLSQLVNDGFAILKVGPELTFVLRETLEERQANEKWRCHDYGDRGSSGLPGCHIRHSGGHSKQPRHRVLCRCDLQLPHCHANRAT